MYDRFEKGGPDSASRQEAAAFMTMVNAMDRHMQMNIDGTEYPFGDEDHTASYEVVVPCGDPSYQIVQGDLSQNPRFCLAPRKHDFRFYACDPGAYEYPGEAPYDVPTVYFEETTLVSWKFARRLFVPDRYQGMLPEKKSPETLFHMRFSTRYITEVVGADADEEPVMYTHKIVTTRDGNDVELAARQSPYIESPLGQGSEFQRMAAIAKMIQKALPRLK